MGDGEDLDHGAAGGSLGGMFEQAFEGAAVGVAGEELGAIDEVQQRHRLAAQAVDDVAVVDDVPVLAVRLGAPARQGHERGGGKEKLQAIVMETDAEPLADQPGGDGVEHLPQGEAGGGGDGDHGLLVVGRALDRQRAEGGALGLDAGGMTAVPPPDDLGDEAAIVLEVGEGGCAAQQQRVADRALEMAVRALDGAVLVGDAAVVAGRRHAVMGAERLISVGEVGFGLGVEIAEGGRQAVAAMLARDATEQPEGVLQPRGEGDIALPADHDMGVLEARPDQAEVIEAMIERRAGGADAEIVHVGEVGQPHRAGRVGLAEDHLLVRPVDRAPGADAALEGAADAGGEVLGVAAPQLLEHGNRPEAGGGLEDRHHLGLENIEQRVRTAPAARGPGGRRCRSRLLQPIARRHAQPGLGGRDGDAVVLPMFHEQPLLVIVDVAAGHGGLPDEGEILRDPIGRDHHDAPSRILILIDAGFSG
jgi:hypothetical protein